MVRCCSITFIFLVVQMQLASNKFLIFFVCLLSSTLKCMYTGMLLLINQVIYFWIADSYLKAKTGHADAHEAGEPGVLQAEFLAEKKQALLDMNDIEKKNDTTSNPQRLSSSNDNTDNNHLPAWTTIESSTSTFHNSNNNSNALV
jgi:uncharacterized membrane protein YcgQ (UPF0703/DUF1980 family)